MALSENSVSVLKLVNEELRNSLMRIVEGSGGGEDNSISSVCDDARYDDLVGSRAVPLRLDTCCMYVCHFFAYVSTSVCMLNLHMNGGLYIVALSYS